MRRCLSAWAAVLSALCLMCAIGADAAGPAKKIEPAKKGATAVKVATSTKILDTILASENTGAKVENLPVVEDLAFLRRVMVDLIGRIPTEEEMQEFLAVPSGERRERVIDKLIADGRFSDRWTVFYADMLRLRSNAEGGTAVLAFVHQAVEKGMPHDELCRQLIMANGKANFTPEVGFILGDGADPMALAAVTSQTFMGVRIACAQCHDHPFDVWKREDFYGLAAFFGKTRRVETNKTKVIYATEAGETVVLWPPEGTAPESARKPMLPKFPFETDKAEAAAPRIARLTKLRTELAQKKQQAEKKASSLDDILAEAEVKAKKATGQISVDVTGVTDENSRAVSDLKIGLDRYATSEWRKELAKLVTAPDNHYFARSLVNRVWIELVGRGFVNPVDDFSESNQPSHPKALDYLADEFVASGFDLRSLVRLIVMSDTYQRAHYVGTDEATRSALEAAFAATPMRRMISEALYDSIVVAGHLTDVKHEAGKNESIVWRHEQIVKAPTKPGMNLAAQNLGGKGQPEMAATTVEVVQSRAYNVEDAIELDFAAALKAKSDEPEVEEMEMVSNEQLEAEMMAKKIGRPGVEYVDRYVKVLFDDNPKFSTALRMVTPAPPTHFLRIFGQSTRDALGEFRDHSASMRQALMMLNGRLTHEAARVGELEPVYPLIESKKPDLNKAIAMVYRELLTRDPSPAEVSEGREIVAAGATPRDGVADLRWILFNCNEFRFIP